MEVFGGMNYLYFETQHNYGGNAIVIPIDIKTPKGAFPSSARIDTGAYMSCFDKAVARQLGINDLTTGTPVGATAANGNHAQGYAFPVTVALLGKSIIIPVAFVPDWDEGTPNLLGMDGFLDRFGAIAIDHRVRQFYY